MRNKLCRSVTSSLHVEGKKILLMLGIATSVFKVSSLGSHYVIPWELQHLPIYNWLPYIKTMFLHVAFLHMKFWRLYDGTGWLNDLGCKIF